MSFCAQREKERVFPVCVCVCVILLNSMNMSWFQFKFSLFDFCHSEFESLFFSTLHQHHHFYTFRFVAYLFSARTLFHLCECAPHPCVCFVLFDLYISSFMQFERACVWRNVRLQLHIHTHTHAHTRWEKRSSLPKSINVSIHANIRHSIEYISFSHFHCLSVCVSAPFSCSISRRHKCHIVHRAHHTLLSRKSIKKHFAPHQYVNGCKQILRHSNGE